METATSVNHPALAASPNRSLNVMKFFTYRLSKEEYGIDIQKVQELRSHDAVIAIANAPMHTKSVVNFRGNIVPAI